MFKFIDTLDKVREFSCNDIITIHSPFTNPSASIILVRIKNDEMRYEGSYENAGQMIERFNKEVVFQDRLILTDEFPKLKYYARRDGGIQ